MPFLGYTAIGLCVAVMVFVMIGRAGAGGATSLTELALALQATVAALFLAEYYPESDDVTQLGMLALSALDRFSEVASTYPSRVSAGRGPRGHRRPGGRRAPVGAVLRRQLRLPGSQRAVFDGLDLELEAGRCTALVGVNGAGKTTIVKLLTRLYEPAPAASASAATTSATSRSSVAAAGQRHLPGLRAVRAVGWRRTSPSAPRTCRPTPERTAAPRTGRRARLHRRLPLGFDTPLSRAYDGGRDLSGGQWQRIAIARTLYAAGAGSRLLIFDEPTAALDVRAEAAFFDRSSTSRRASRR